MAILSTPFHYVASVPPVTRAFTGATVFASLFYYWIRWQTNDPHAAPWLTLIPGSSVFYPWTFVTAGLVETNLIELAVTLLLVPASLRYMERLWGTIETLKFILVSIAIPNIISFVLNWIEFVATKNADLFLYGMQYHGQMALQTAVLVAFTQIIPEHQVQIFGIFRARVKSLPMAYVTLSTVLCLIGLQCPYILIQFGWLAAYVFLRFYKKNTGDVMGGGSTYGDHSETFAFLIWFPPFVHKPVTLLANTIHSLATRFHLIPSAGPDLEAGGYAPVPGGARAEAERRRAMALKALDQRMANSHSPSTSQSQAESPRSAGPRAPAPAHTSVPLQTERSRNMSEVEVDIGKSGDIEK
ncbi:hypothetical protein JAAARDRAFT_53505 [Jaapia argillacea MUCL 33604]|uniref:Eukaryotic integral membrane protein n=1 Tax=Jaapia argillacea MUCL 33604 TaxID=933084 RepID=A0A067QAU5_9AGAM|nr:hypothetical protein JAAARDRAFT_53505 [Jaapia argillacea MUCL 33604]